MRLLNSVAVLFFASALMTSPAKSEPLSPAAVEQLDRAVDDAISQDRLAGAVVLVAKDGEIVYRRAAGLADIEANRPMTPNTIFRLTSLSKPIVTAAAMRLVEMGLLDLDRPVTDWLPEFTPAHEGLEPAISLRQLLNHTSGIGYAADEGGKGPYTDAGVQDGGFGLGITLEENLRRLASADLRFAPGDGWNYGLGIDVIGRVIERATNLPLEVAVRELVTQRLHMNDTVFHVPAWDQGRLAANYRDGEAGPVRMHDGERVPLLGMIARFDPSRNTDPDSWPSAGAGMSGTAEDMMRLLLALSDRSDQFLDGAEVETMMTPQTGALPYVDLYMDVHAGLPKNGAAWAFGIGGAVLKHPDNADTPQSAGTFAWTGAYGHTWFVDPKEKLIVVSMTNTAWEGIYGKFAHDVRDAVYQAD
jgi:CubicO group peptidase (beta-lactamase class C family)